MRVAFRGLGRGLGFPDLGAHVAREIPKNGNNTNNTNNNG